MTDRQPQEDLRSYGRRRGRAPSARQQALWRDTLPRVAIPSDPPALADLPALFPQPVRDVWLEIGFGGGEHLVWQAGHHPGIGFIGCEPFEDGVVKLLGAIELEGIANVRICTGDARPLLRLLPGASIGRVFILFPDPWPKKRHHKRRLVQPAFVHLLASRTKPGAYLHAATDWEDYAIQMLDVLTAEPLLANTATGFAPRPESRPPTKFETRGARLGHGVWDLVFRRR